MKLLVALILFASLTIHGESTEIPAFPGAEGFGSHTPGGRGGKVIKVTNLNDHGPGSLRAALEASGPRIVVFETGGTIDLQSDLVLFNPYLTIAGQTAPGGGICLSGFPIRIRTHDVIIRGVRFRSGDRKADQRNKEKNLRLESLHVAGRRERPVYNVIIDHCSFSWGIDKNLGVWSRDFKDGNALHDITVQWCISSEALFSSFHPKGTHHAMGMFFSGARNVSAHHNLIAHCNARNPQFSKYTAGEGINNVVYDWGSYATEIESGAKVNLIGNSYLPGKSRVRDVRGIIVKDSEERQGTMAYVQGNVGPGREADEGDDWNAVTGDISSRSKTPVIPLSGVKIHKAKEAFGLVMANAGAQPRDSVDVRILKDVNEGTGAGIASQDDVGGWPTLQAGSAPNDTDDDGMPDEWETARGLDPNNKDDGGADRNADGYTNIEEYINSLLPWY
jgi:hypothetical protein